MSYSPYGAKNLKSINNYNAIEQHLKVNQNSQHSNERRTKLQFSVFSAGFLKKKILI